MTICICAIELAGKSHISLLLPFLSSFNHSCKHATIHSITSLLFAFIASFTHSFIHPLTFFHSSICSIFVSCIHVRIHQGIHSLNESFVHSFILLLVLSVRPLIRKSLLFFLQVIHVNPLLSSSEKSRIGKQNPIVTPYS